MRKLAKNETRLLILFGAAVFVALNLFAVRAWLSHRTALDTAIASGTTAMAAAAARAGACFVDGLEVHCQRTAIDFQAWTGREADTDQLREALDEFLDA